MPAGWGTLLAVLVVLGAAVGVGWLLAPRMAEQVTSLSRQLPQSLAHLQGQLEQYGWGQQLLKELPDRDSLLDKLLAGQGNWLRRTLGLFSTTVGVLGNLYIVLFVSVFLMADPRPYRRGIVLLVPPAHRDRARPGARPAGHHPVSLGAGQALRDADRGHSYGPGTVGAGDAAGA